MHRSISRRTRHRDPVDVDRRVRSASRVRTRQTRLSLPEIVCLFAVAFALLTAAALSGERPDSDVRHAVTVQVDAAHTLWSLAAEHPVSGQSTEQTVETIRELNGLRSNSLAAGSRILVPAPAPSGGQLATR